MGAWIETYQAGYDMRVLTVAPFMGAWIETHVTSFFMITDGSCSLYGSMD